MLMVAILIESEVGYLDNQIFRESEAGRMDSEAYAEAEAGEAEQKIGESFI